MYKAGIWGYLTTLIKFYFYVTIVVEQSTMYYSPYTAVIEIYLA